MFRLLVMVLFMTIVVQIQKSSAVHHFPSVRLTNIDNVIYYGTIGIGNPSQNFRIVFDTTSPYLRIINKNFNFTNSVALARSQYKNTSFNPHNRKLYDARYLDYNITAFLSTDTVNIASHNVMNQKFLEVANINITDEYMIDLHLNISNRIYDGLLGLSYTNERVSGISPIFYNMIEEGLVSSRIFSLYLNRNTSSYLGGELILGGSDPAYYKGYFKYVRITSSKYFQFTIRSIEMNDVMGLNFIWCEEHCKAIVDSSTWKIMGPEEDISLINRLLRTDSNGRKDCNAIFYSPLITFNLDGKTFDLDGTDYFIPHPRNNSICITVFWKNESTYANNIKWVLGMPFIGHYYTEFDMERDRLGFALAKNGLEYKIHPDM